MAKKTNKKKSIKFIVICQCELCKEKFNIDMEESFTVDLINEIFKKENTVTGALMFTHTCNKKRPEVRGLGRVVVFEKIIN
jgi:hypothetical protein